MIERILFIFLTAFIILSVTFILCQLLPLEVVGSRPNELVSFWDYQVDQGYYYHVSEIEALENPSSYTVQVELGGIHYYYAPYSVMHRYFSWLTNIFTKWDWGTSSKVSIGHSAIDIIMEHLPYSMRLNIISMIISIPVGIALGVIAALKKNTWVDNVISTVIMIFISVPSFVFISFLLIWLSYSTGWLPPNWPSDAQAVADPANALKAYIIPVAALCFGSIAGFTRYTRAELTEVMSSEFLLLARTKGLTKAQSVVRHALRNSMVPIVPMIIGEFIGILSGSMVLEQIYRIPGVGYVFIEGINNKDWSVVMVDMAIYTLIGLFATLLVDLSYGIVDPRIRMGGKK